MKHVFSAIEKGDKLYIVYQDLNKDYQIGEAVVTGFHNWTYEIGDRYETYGEKPQTNIKYTFENITFSRNLENVLDNTHFTDSVEFSVDCSKVFSDRFVETFTTYEEAKEHVVSTLTYYIDVSKENIEKIKTEIEKYNNNLKSINMLCPR